MKYLMMLMVSLLLVATSADAQNNYRLKPGDSLSVEVLEDASLNRTLLVLPDGTITFPFAGSISASGRTLQDVQQSIRSGISSNFAAPPTVFVTVSSLREPRPATSSGPAVVETMNIYISGEVGAPGLKPMIPGTTFLQALSQSGGFTNFAATKRVQLRRSDPITGQQTVYKINYRALSNGQVLSNDIVLQDGDVILVPERRLFE